MRPNNKRTGDLLGTGTQYHTVQDHVKAKLAYDFTPTMRASYTLGWWKNDSDGRPASYLRDAAGQPGIQRHESTSTARSTPWRPPTSICPTKSSNTVMHGLSVKSNTKGVFDWEVAASLYDYSSDILRAPTAPLPGALRPAARAASSTWAARAGIPWPPRAPGARRRAGHRRSFVEFRLPAARPTSCARYRERHWQLDQRRGRRALSAFNGKTAMQSLYAQDTWTIRARLEDRAGRALERWSARRRRSRELRAAIVSFGHGSATKPISRPRRRWPTRSVRRLGAESIDWPRGAHAHRGRAVPGRRQAQRHATNNDPNLKPEKSWTTELTAERKLDNGLLRLTAFCERTKDSLYSQTNVLVTPNVTNVQNVDAIRTNGLEVAYEASDVGCAAWISVPAPPGPTRRSPATRSSRPAWENSSRASLNGARPALHYHVNDQLAVTLAARYSGTQFSARQYRYERLRLPGRQQVFTTDVRDIASTGSGALRWVSTT